jgi:hypothetical protein
MATTRARSVVRISRRSSEPQVEGSKPSGPANNSSSAPFSCVKLFKLVLASE